jgi:hypothetical protein
VILCYHLSAAALRTLLALVEVYEADGRATVRDVAVAAERSIQATHAQLRVLRAADFVTWEDGRAGTLRPLLRRVA